ncbi:MAG: tRNA (adenosine(37)-N6)-threonylcarbamoyltransferase complex ATPase subunit type 1 TsaE [Alphaproteobacteria bacterium]|nr:tRNA (adenosine(37)-N6)-threonylcarbamoyltransferase complex ATPase subunit type 1 TsaE [Alphaproteobacteria bacterium]
MDTICRTEDETALAAAALAADLRAGDVIFLRGNLGAGKSVFARALIRTLMDSPLLEVPSPTFTLVQTYETALLQVYHYDLYRIEDPDEIFELGWEDCLREGVTIVEWPERLGPHISAYGAARVLDICIEGVENEPMHRIISIQISKDRASGR